MRKERRIVLLLAITLTAVSCDKKPPTATSDTDAAKLRPEVAAARKNTSPTPFPQGTVSATPSP